MVKFLCWCFEARSSCEAPELKAVAYANPNQARLVSRAAYNVACLRIRIQRQITKLLNKIGSLCVGIKVISLPNFSIEPLP